MKSCLTLPVLAQSNDVSTLLSVKFQTSLETGVEHILDAVGSQNVTQMSSLLQNLVEDVISQGPEGNDAYYKLDGDVVAALEMIKQELLGDIRGALNEAHCNDQVELHQRILCFESCEERRQKGAGSCPSYCDGSVHKRCRDSLLIQYHAHIAKCRALDDFMKDFEEASCPKAEKKCCLQSHSTWNCGGLCAEEIAGFEVDSSFGDWLTMQVNKFQTAYGEWTTLHQKCTDAYHSYVEADARCDCMQTECETNNCKYETCHFLNCEDTYNSCWAGCEAEYERTNKVKECLEKDRKIDWSATEKIECYVDVLLAKPSKEDLLSTCGTEDCHNKYREEKYKLCNQMCPEVDFEAEWDSHLRREDDQDVTGEGLHFVRTRHRATDGSDADVRCTSHLDLDYQVPPCCHPCEVRPEPPCTGKEKLEDEAGDWIKTSYMWLHYGQFDHFDTSNIADLDADICYSGEHTYAYAYNLCDCTDCPCMPDVPPAVCTGDKACSARYDTATESLTVMDGYDYRQHDIQVECTAHVTKPTPVPEWRRPSCQNGEILTTPPSLSGGCQRCTCAGGQWQCACSMRHRKEINDLTDEEFNKFAEAVNKLKADGTWTKMAMLHHVADKENAGGAPHGSKFFLPWHRKFVIEVENRLQLAVNDCSVSMPYWNWAMELPSFLESKVWAADRLGSSNSDLGSWSYRADNLDDICVKDGAFGSRTTGSSFGGGSNDFDEVRLQGDSDCIMRRGRKPTGQSYTTILSNLEQPSLGINEYEEMSKYIERNVHNSFHSATGGYALTNDYRFGKGHMNSMLGPYDPLFFLHHGFIDFLWSKWQSHHVDKTQRLHRQDDLMPELLSDGRRDLFPVSDVAMNMDILDDDAETDVQEKACVVYHERHHADAVCAQEWEHIQACISKVVEAERLHEVPRIKEMTSVGDVCSPVNPVQADFDRSWLETMAAMGMMKADAIPDIMQWESTLNIDIDQRTPALDESEASACDKKLCFSTSRLFEICEELSHVES